MQNQRDNKPIERILTKIEGCETKPMSNGKYMSKLRDSNGINYIVFHTKKDGNKTKAYEALEQMPMSGINQFAEIAYVEETFEKEGKEYTSRKAIGIKPSQEQSETSENVSENKEELQTNKEEEEGFLPIN